MSAIDMTPADMFSYFQILAQGFGAALSGNGSGIETITNPNGDSISYDPTVSTSYDGVQPALMFQIGSEQLTEFGNGAATVTDSNGDTLAVDNGKLYGLKAGSSQRVDLGAASSSQAWQNAITGGYTDTQGEKDLQGVFGSSGGAVSSASPEQELLNTLTLLLQQLQFESG